jgi:hypothetical protein
MWGTDWIELAQDRDRWQVHVSAVINLGFHKMREIYWLAANRLASQERLWRVECVNKYVERRHHVVLYNILYLHVPLALPCSSLACQNDHNLSQERNPSEPDIVPRAAGRFTVISQYNSKVIPSGRTQWYFVRLVVTNCIKLHAYGNLTLFHQSESARNNDHMLRVAWLTWRMAFEFLTKSETNINPLQSGGFFILVHHQAFPIQNILRSVNTAYLCFVWIWEQTAIISLYCINWLVFITETECLLRGTDWILMCFVWIWEQTAIISLYSINWLACITETECVYCAVRTEYVLCGSEQTAIISLYSINWLVFMTETESVYCAVRTEYVLCGSENKQRLFPYTALTDWFLWLRRRVFTARYGLNICVVCVDLRTNSDYVPIQH